MHATVDNHSLVKDGNILLGINHVPMHGVLVTMQDGNLEDPPSNDHYINAPSDDQQENAPSAAGG